MKSVCAWCGVTIGSEPAIISAGTPSVGAEGLTHSAPASWEAGDLPGRITDPVSHGLCRACSQGLWLEERGMMGLWICRSCGCTALYSCPSGCEWAAPNLCSACVESKRLDWPEVECAEVAS